LVIFSTHLHTCDLQTLKENHGQGGQTSHTVLSDE